MTTIVWILAGVTAWCVAALALALLIGPVARKRPAQRRRWQTAPSSGASTGAPSWDTVREPLIPITATVSVLQREPQLQ